MPELFLMSEQTFSSSLCCSDLQSKGVCRVNLSALNRFWLIQSQLEMGVYVMGYCWEAAPCIVLLWVQVLSECCHSPYWTSQPCLWNVDLIKSSAGDREPVKCEMFITSLPNTVFSNRGQAFNLSSLHREKEPAIKAPYTLVVVKYRD